MKPEIDKAYLKEFIRYNRDSGEFIWAKPPNNAIKVGAVAGSVNPRGYIELKIKNVSYKGHRVAWFIEFGVMPTSGIDHINGNKLDNRISNLRFANDSQNQQNLRGPTKRNSTGFLGVSFNKRVKKYQSMIRANGVNHWLGYFNTAEDAATKYLSRKRELHSYCTI